MKIFHESLPEEAQEVSLQIESAYGIRNEVIERSLDFLFYPIPKFDGFGLSLNGFNKMLSESENRKTLIITSRDLYGDSKSKDDDWVFGSCYSNLMIASNARLKGQDSKPRKSLEVDKAAYMRRLSTLSIHELGHAVFNNAPHFQQAKWVNAKTGYQMRLGPHCTDNSCVMYEVVDIKAPSAEEGYMLLGNEKKFDAGFDDVLSRMENRWFCNLCKPLIKLDETFS